MEPLPKARAILLADDESAIPRAFWPVNSVTSSAQVPAASARYRPELPGDNNTPRVQRDACRIAHCALAVEAACRQRRPSVTSNKSCSLV